MKTKFLPLLLVVLLAVSLLSSCHFSKMPFNGDITFHDISLTVDKKFIRDSTQSTSDLWIFEHGNYRESIIISRKDAGEDVMASLNDYAEYLNEQGIQAQLSIFLDNPAVLSGGTKDGQYCQEVLFAYNQSFYAIALRGGDSAEFAALIHTVTVKEQYITTYYSKENVDEFMVALGELEGTGLLSDVTLEEDKCFNVTPLLVSNAMDCKIFKFSDSHASFVMIDNEVYPLCKWFGGYGFVNAVPCDFDNDGNEDLLVASSWGSGLHRSEISVFNTETKEFTVIYDTSMTDNPGVDLFVAISTPSVSSADAPNSIWYTVYSAEIKSNGNNYPNMSYLATGVIGSISAENGEAVFTPSTDK